MRTAILESCHQLVATRPQFEGAPMEIKTISGANYQVRTATCGCTNQTRIVDGHGVSCDGRTDLCDEHALPEQEDE